MSLLRQMKAAFMRRGDTQTAESEVQEKITKLCEPLMLSDSVLRRIMQLLLVEMEAGLSKDQCHSAIVRMLPSFVRSVPNGTEKGNFLALDLGGTNFRVLLIRLKGRDVAMSSKIFRVPHNVMVGTAEELFDHIAACLAQFSHEEKLEKEKLPLGFTFSFPCSQDGLTSGKLISWTKGFKASGVEGADVVRLLQEAVHRRKDTSIDVVALLNDTTGTLMACAHKNPSCNIGVIVGTGSNACYMEKMKNVHKLAIQDAEPDEIIINTEWGAFGDNGVLDFIRTSFDYEVDRNSINPGKQIFEKMISGMYMGELVRLLLERLTKDGLLFDGHGSDALSTSGKFPTKFVSEIESEAKEEERTFTKTMEILEDLDLENVNMDDCVNVAYVCSVVSTRAAHLCAAGIAVLLNRIQKPFCTVGVDGSVYRYHPEFKLHLSNKIASLVDPGLKFDVMLSEDGSGVGAALVAAVACRVSSEKAVSRLGETMEDARLSAEGADGRNGKSANLSRCDGPSVPTPEKNLSSVGHNKTNANGQHSAAKLNGNLTLAR